MKSRPINRHSREPCRFFPTKVCQSILYCIAIFTHSESALGQDNFLLAKDLHTTLSRHTLRGKNWAEFYDEDGTIVGRNRIFGIRSYFGRWSVHADMVCYDYEGSTYDTCSKLKVKERTVLHFDEHGKLKEDGSATRDFGNTLSTFR